MQHVQDSIHKAQYCTYTVPSHSSEMSTLLFLNRHQRLLMFYGNHGSVRLHPKIDTLPFQGKFPLTPDAVRKCGTIRDCRGMEVYKQWKNGVRECATNSE